MRLLWTREIDDDLEAGVGASRSRESNMPDIPSLLDKRIEMIMKCYVDEPDGSQTVDLYKQVYVPGDRGRWGRWWRAS